MGPIVGIGELLWDVFPDGRKVAGGAPFNFAYHCHQLGHEAVIVSRVGDDDLGRELRAQVRRLGLSDEYVQTDPDHPTGTVRVSVDAQGQPSYEIVEGVAWDHIGEEGGIDEGLAHDVVAVCFGTLAQRHPVSRSTIQNFVERGPEMPTALRVFDVNLRPPFVPTDARLREWAHAADWVKVNAHEWEQMGRAFDMPSTNLARGHSRQRMEDRSVWIVTDGGGMLRIEEADSILEEPPVAAKVVDTVGAGDSFTAAMVCLHLEGRPLRECARFATQYAARVCEHQGATPRISRAAVERVAFGGG